MAKVDRWLPDFYDDLRKIAQQQIARERPGHTLAPTALVHEAYMNLARIRDISFKDESHVKAAFAGEMRRALIQHARKKNAAKRGGGARRERLSLCMPEADDRVLDVLVVEEALAELTTLDERDARIVELHIYGGLNFTEMEEVLGLTAKTIAGRLKFALAFLEKRLSNADAPEGD